ncbi:MAG: ATP-binding protein [Hydrococcus sp. Prado102]|jgi:C4-dicarboxylate-specific signal transduction histidine kinase|nr:ATP-binding protein [Hydrococcus sp. Prado102]
MLKRLKRLASNTRLRTVLIVPFVVQIVGTVGLVGYFSFKNGQAKIADLANQLMEQASDRVDQHLNSYLSIPNKLIAINLRALQRKQIDPNNFSEIANFFWQQVKEFDVSYINYGLTTGEYAGAGYLSDTPYAAIMLSETSAKTQGINFNITTDSQGNPIIKEPDPEYDHRQEAWYLEAIQKGQPIWSQIYIWDGSTPLMSLAASRPIYNSEKKIIGAIGIDMLLSRLSYFLKQIDLSPSSKIFILERNGDLIASSGDELPFRKVEGKKQRLSVTQSRDVAIQASAKAILDRFDRFDNIQKSQQLDAIANGEHHFVRVTPWRDSYGLDWLVVLVVPEADFMAQVDANNRTTILLCLGALVATTLLGFYTARWIAQPIIRLSEASAAIASGDLNQTVEVEHIQELRTLARSFNTMSEQLQASFNAQAQDRAQLEERVQKRTQELSKAEKMADLGQLIASVAHEINTPIGAINASIGNIATSLKQSLYQLPQLLEKLSPERLADFFKLLEIIEQPKPSLSSREERQLKRSLKERLTNNKIENAGSLADLLSQMGIDSELDAIAPLLGKPDSLTMIQTAHQLSTIQNNSDNIKLAVDRASRIVFALKSYSRQAPTEQKVKASVIETIETVLTLYRGQIKRGVEVRRFYQSIAPILCYPDELTQVWSNLINNGLQAMKFQGCLEISVFERDSAIVVAITDSGGGIAPEIQSKIFEPFFTTKPYGEGSGLGLDIVRKIIDKHKGTIELTSQPGHTTFRISLPSH